MTGSESEGSDEKCEEEESITIKRVESKADGESTAWRAEIKNMQAARECPKARV
jgi:hypothetical protein